MRALSFSTFSDSPSCATAILAALIGVWFVVFPDPVVMWATLTTVAFVYCASHTVCEYVRQACGADWQLAVPNCRVKFPDQLFKLAFHAWSTFHILGLYDVTTLTDPNWWFSRDRFSHQQHEMPHFLLYHAQIARWIFGWFLFSFVEPRNRDHSVMAAHHLATCSLLLGSLALSMDRVGVAVLLVHDSSDIFVCVLQMLHYLGVQGWRFLYAGECAFALNFAVWCAVRLYAFPAWIIAPLARIVFFCSLTDSADSACSTGSAGSSSRSTAQTDPDDTDVSDIPDVPGTLGILVLLLAALQLMHVYWACLFAKIAIKISSEGAERAGHDAYHGARDVTRVELSSNHPNKENKKIT